MSKWKQALLAFAAIAVPLKAAQLLRNTKQRRELERLFGELTSAGNDAEIRALTIDPATDFDHKDDNGTKWFRTPGGALIDEATVDRAFAKWGDNRHALALARDYEQSKTPHNSKDGVVQSADEA